MKKPALIFLLAISSLSSFASTGMMLSCQSHGEVSYSVIIIAEDGGTPSLYVAQDGTLIFKEKVNLEGEEAESSGALGKQSYLRVDYEDDHAGLLKFCKNGKEVEVAFGYKECGESSANWPNKRNSRYVPDLDCK
jgi:hypothetical protein